LDDGIHDFLVPDGRAANHEFGPDFQPGVAISAVDGQ
jgi:hypothetical protein